MLPDHTEATSSLAHLAPARYCSQRPLCAQKSHGGGGWWFLRSQPWPGQAHTPRQSSHKATSSTAGPGQRQTYCCARPMPSPVAATTVKRTGGNLYSLMRPRIQFQLCHNSGKESTAQVFSSLTLVCWEDLERI